MLLLTLAALLFVVTGVCEGQYRQKLTCPYTSSQKNMDRVWCKRDDMRQHCCTGFTFRTGNAQLADHSLSVQDNGQSFVVSVSSLPLGDGVYWCGLRNGTDIIIKLAESQLYSGKYGGEKKRDTQYESVIEEKQR
ncbi:uncharacterized protein [Salminus brasiliensis]|uniref:uncharacterized protein isoform X2 n=1 Tax=Salminus brasiliensis TaxID=930266 RepID=UPI003B82EEA2